MVYRMHAATVDVLVRKGKFEPPIAVAVAEAIDMAINNAQLVTVPVMDARFATLEAKLDARFAAMQSGLDARFAEVNARFAASEVRHDSQFVALEAKFDAKLAQFKTDLILWIIVAMVGNTYLPKIVAGITNAISMVVQALK